MSLNQETIPCRICGQQTRMLGTKLCDRCWELETSIHANPGLAAIILAECLAPWLESLAKAAEKEPS